MTEKIEKEEKAKPKAKSKSTIRPYKNLTVSQKAEAIALYRSGKVTLEDLSKKFGKRPEAFSRLFKRLEITKGGAIPDMAKKLEAVVEEAVVSELQKTLNKIATTKDEHYRMASAIAKLAWAEIVRARTAGTDIAGLKDFMATLKTTGEIIGSARKELFAILNVDKYEQESEFENLPELTVRELTNTELFQLQNQSVDDLGVESTDVGEGMMSDTLAEGL